MNYKLVENTIAKEEKLALKRLIDSNEQLTYGKNVKKLENKIAKFHKRKYCVMVNSGSSANLLGIASSIYSENINLNHGDEVIVPTLSWSTTYAPLIQYGLKLRFVDVNIHTLNIDEEILEKAITKKTRAIFCVNILGRCCNYTIISKIAKKHKIYIFEDNCESFGSKFNGKISGSFGLFSSLSSYFSHHINTIEGGYLLTDNFKLYCNALAIRSHGWIREQPRKSHLINKNLNSHLRKFRFFLPGYNIRPTELSAIIGLEQMKKIKRFINNRIINAKFFFDIFKEKDLILQKFNKDSTYFGFSIIIKNQFIDIYELIKKINLLGIETRPIISGNILNNQMMRYADYSVYKKPIKANYIENFGFMIGNRSELFSEKEKKILKNLTKIF